MRFLIGILLTTCGLAGFSQDAMNVDLLFHWNDTTIPSTSLHNNRYNDVWGYSKNGEEYAIIGSTDGVHIFDLNDPNEMLQVAFVAGAAQGNNLVHRDYHEYRGYLYAVADEGPSTLQIIDISPLPNPVQVVYDTDVLFPRTHNIFIDTATAKLYACGGPLGFAVFSLADPTNPVQLVHPPNEVPWWDNTIGLVHDTYVRNDTAFLNAEGRGLYVVDFNDTGNPQLLGSLTEYPQSGYNHSGWLHHNRPIYALADETHGKDIKLLDVSDLSDIELLDTIGTGIHNLSIPHNLIFKEDVLYTSYYHDGFYMWDCSDPENAQVIGYYDTSEEVHSINYVGAWGVYPLLPSGRVLVSDMQNGLFVFNVGQALSVEAASSASQAYQVWPNPSSDKLQLRGLVLNSTRQLLEIFNMNGKVVMSQHIALYPGNTTEIDISALRGGIYLLSIGSGAERSVQRITIIK